MTAELLIQHASELGVQLVREHRFHPGRRWRFDLASPALSLAIEIEGGAWTRGRHTRGAGFVKDLEKYAEAAVLGWTVLRFTPGMVMDGTARDTIKRFLEARRIPGAAS